MKRLTIVLAVAALAAGTVTGCGAATAELKADPATASIPVIALTAHAMATDRDRALAAGCDDYDTKPIELARLLGKIEGFLGPKASE